MCLASSHVMDHVKYLSPVRNFNNRAIVRLFSGSTWWNTYSFSTIILLWSSRGTRELRSPTESTLYVLPGNPRLCFWIDEINYTVRTNSFEERPIYQQSVFALQICSSSLSSNTDLILISVRFSLLLRPYSGVEIVGWLQFAGTL